MVLAALFTTVSFDIDIQRWNDNNYDETNDCKNVPEFKPIDPPSQYTEENNLLCFCTLLVKSSEVNDLL